MVGVITHWDILAHPVVTIRCFGWGVFFRAIGPWQGQPFLSLLRDAGHFGAIASSQMPTILERCIALEIRAKTIYTVLAEALADQATVCRFFSALAQQEQDHADLLEICRAAAVRGHWRANMFNPWQEYLPRLEQQMVATEAALGLVNTVEAALQLVVQIEMSEINEVFYAALAATDTAFVKKLRPFQVAMERHMAYIVERLSQLAPELITTTRELRAKFPGVRKR